MSQWSTSRRISPEPPLSFNSGRDIPLKTSGVADLGRLDYANISNKLTGHRLWVGTRYYIGRVPQTGDVTLYAAQRHFLAKLATATAFHTRAELGITPLESWELGGSNTI